MKRQLAFAAMLVMTSTPMGSAQELRPVSGGASAPVHRADITVEKNAADRLVERERALDEVVASRERSEYNLQPDGNLLGRVQAINEVGTPEIAKVRLIFLKEGKVVAQATPNEEGTFQANGLAPGIYAVVAAGPSGMASSGLRLLPPPDRPPSPKASTIGDAKIIGSTSAVNFPLSLSTIQPVDVRPALALAMKHVPGLSSQFQLPPSESSPNGSPAPSGGMNYLGRGFLPREPLISQDDAISRAFGARPARSSVRAEENVSSNETGETVSRRAEESERILEALQSFSYPLNKDHALAGLVRSFDSAGHLTPAKVKLFFLRDGQVRFQSQVSEQGDFRIDDMDDGYYSLVAVGSGGFAMMGVRILPPPDRPEAPKASTIGRFKQVSQPLGGGIPLTFAPAPAGAAGPAFSFAASQGAGSLASVGAGSLGSAAAGASALGTTAAGTAAAGAGAGAGAGGAALGAGLAPAVGAIAAGAAIAGNNNNSSSGSSTQTPVSPNGT